MWDLDKSKLRISKQWQILNESGITVKKLTREMDLSGLPLNEARRVHGAHLYADITNLSAVHDHPALCVEHFKPLHRYLHTLRIEQRRIVHSVFDGDKIQVQGGKFHGLLFKPYDDDAKLSWHAVLMGIALHETLRKALPVAFPAYPALIPTIGIDIGDTLVANIGVRGDRELISVGSAANHAAKILGANNALVVTDRVWKLLTHEQQKLFSSSGDTYRLDWNAIKDAEELLSTNGFTWTAAGSAQKMKATIAGIPLADIDSEEARSRVDLATLGPRKFKRCYAGTIYADLDGYTKLIDSLMGNDEKLASAVKLLHLFRYELQRVTEDDFDGVAIQHQGDRLQAIIHIPYDDEDRVREKVAEMCLSFNSSVESVLNAEHAMLDFPIHVAIGASAGKTVIVRSGTIGDLDASGLGHAVLAAENLQIASKGNEIRLSAEIFGNISTQGIKDLFKFEKSRDCYVAVGATWNKVEDLEIARELNVGTPIFFNDQTSKVQFDNGKSRQGDHSHLHEVRNTRNWGL